MHSWHCTQHTNIIVTSQIIKFNNSFRFSGGHPPSFEYDKKFDSSFMLEIKFIHDTNRINNKFYSFPPGNRHCETSGIWYLYSAQPVSYFYFVIFLFQQDFCSFYQTNFWQSVQFTNKKNPNFHVKSDFCPQAVYVACDIYEVWFVLSIFSIIKPILNVKHWKSNCVNQSWKLQMSIANVFHRKTTATSNSKRRRRPFSAWNVSDSHLNA